MPSGPAPGKENKRCGPDRAMGMTMKELTEKIKTEALRLGFCKVGVARAGRLDAEAGFLQEWIGRGYNATMTWMARNAAKRIDPASVLPGVQSVIAVAFNYYTNVAHSEDPATGKISRYAWGDDYHELVSTRLRRLSVFINAADPSAECKIYVDTGPVMERAWAQRAGLGWIGKHTNLITRDYGSWVFLGEILTTLALDEDPPATDHCGTCRRCIDACPTQAIVGPGILDANRCISYLTIEHRGDIAEEFGERFDRWIYGCDICQDVCPWNRKFSQPGADPSLLPRPENVAPPLGEIASMTQQEFSERYRKSPVKRAKLSGLSRNARFVASHQQTRKP